MYQKMKQVLFWSKYSNNCKKLLSLMHEKHINIENVCVDNKKIRSRILNDKRINLSKVPTILALYETGVIEKYEGEKAFALFHSAFNQVKQSSQPTVQKTMNTAPKNTEPQVNTPPVNNKPNETEPKNSEATNGMTSLEDLTGEDLFKDDQDDRVTNKNLPVKTSSKIASIAADIAKSREVMDSNIPKPTQNNIVPNK